MPERALVLDTHVWLWYVAASPEITPDLLKQIKKTLVSSSVLIPAICVWEVGMLWRKDRILLSKRIDTWVQDALEHTGFTLLPMSQAIALESAILPGHFHSDPADCMIVATARIENAIVVTRDSRIIDYGKAGHVEVLAV